MKFAETQELTSLENKEEPAVTGQGVARTIESWTPGAGILRQVRACVHNLRDGRQLCVEGLFPHTSGFDGREKGKHRWWKSGRMSCRHTHEGCA